MSTINDCELPSSIYQQNSWTPFSVSEDIFRTIFAARRVHPFFLNHVHAFGSRDGSHETDMFGCYFYRIEPDWGFRDASQEPFYGEQRRFGPVFQGVWLMCAELCYILRYVQKTGRDTHPWSVRQTGVYQKYDFNEKSSNWIFLQPSSQAKRLATPKPDVPTENPLDTHVLILSSTVDAWRWYLKELDQKIRSLVCI